MSGFRADGRAGREPAAALGAFALGAVLLLGAAGCASRNPQPAELDPLSSERPPREPLPDEMERAAARLAALALADRPDAAGLALGLMGDAENERAGPDQSRTGLVEAAADVVVAIEGGGAYLSHARRTLRRPDVSAARQRRLQRALDRQPLALARRMLSDDRRAKVGSVFNRVSRPVTQLAMSGVADPVGSVRSAISSLLTVHQFPISTLRQRRALAAYGDFLRRHPGAPETEEVEREIENLAERLARHRWDHAMKSARRALERGSHSGASMYLARAERALPGQAETAELREEASRGQQTRERNILRSLGGDAAAFAGDLSPERHAFAVRLLTAPAGELADLESETAGSPGERAFASAIGRLGPGQDAEFIQRVRRVSARGSADPMARHATAALLNPWRNPYGYYRASMESDRSRRARWLLLGPLAGGPGERELPRPVEYALDIPTGVSALLTAPIRLLQDPGATRKMNPEVLVSGERYARRFPDGAHAERVHADLERRYKRLGLWSRALEHNRARGGGSEGDVRRYREGIAESLRTSAESERRSDMKLAFYRALLRDYGDTPAARDARGELSEWWHSASAQKIRLSRDFLIQHRAVSGPEGLGIRPELLDGRRRNGEIAESGVTLLGGTRVRIELEGREPALRELEAERFARLAARIEQAAYRTLVEDERERPTSDPQRDRFLERARLGLLDRPDARPSARSESEFLGSREKHGLVRTRTSRLPLDVVVRGDLETLGLAAVPLIRLPAPPADALLYR